MLKDDTIAQIVTPPGAGGVGIIRISGPCAHDIGRLLIQQRDSITPRLMILAHAYASCGRVLDQGLYVEFVAPHSFTGENVCEFQGHGSPVGLHGLLNRVFALGARAAEPGEFSMRAFLHGKLDLVQAEAIAQTIAAQSEEAYHSANRQLKGELSRFIKGIRDPLVNLSMRMQTEVEFPDEFPHAYNESLAQQDLYACLNAIRTLLDGYQSGRFIQQGVCVALCGPPNAGKSSLLNAFLGYDRAIVSPTAGTTRDTIEARTMVGSMLFRLIDTAGLADTTHVLEQAGMARARLAMQHADVAVLVLSHDSDWVRFIQEEWSYLPPHVVTVLNKSDESSWDWLDISIHPILERSPQVRVSAKTGHGLDHLKAAMTQVLGLKTGMQSSLVTLARHAQLLEEASVALAHAHEALQKQVPIDVVLVDIHLATHRLGEVLGENVSEDIVHQIFKQFCIGK